MQAPVNLSRQPDGKDARISELEQELAATRQPEAADSLRRRTIKLANELYDFEANRFRHHPPYAYPNPSDPNPSDERKQAIKVCEEYDQKTQDLYMKLYKDRAVGIIKEYEGKGIAVGFLEASAKQRPPTAALLGSGWEGSAQDEVKQFRDLAYHVDAHDNAIHFEAVH